MPAIGCVLWASPHSWHGRLGCARLRVVGLASLLAWLRLARTRPHAVGLASHSWEGRLACTRPLALGLAFHSWHGLLVCALGCLCWPRLTRVVGQHAWSRLKAWHCLLACARLPVVGLASLLAWPPRLRSAACCWPRLTFGAWPPCLRSAACCWPRLTLSLAASPAFGGVLLASPHSWHGRLACARLLAVGLASLLGHGRLACDRLRVVGLTPLLAWPPRLRSAACC